MEGIHFIVATMIVFSISLTIALIVQIYTIPPQVSLISFNLFSNKLDLFN